MRTRPGLPVHEGHDRVDPDVRTARRGLHRPRFRRRHADACRWRAHRQDAIGDGARKVDRPVHVRQGGRVSRTRGTGKRRSRCCDRGRRETMTPRVLHRLLAVAAAATLVAGCAAAPSRDDPFEPMNRVVVPRARGRRRPCRQADGPGVCGLHAAPDTAGDQEFLQQHRRPVLLHQRRAAKQARPGRPQTWGA